jgi:ring-1,2-phenylacetyl-CoA epoxidase subunit PaaE
MSFLKKLFGGKSSPKSAKKGMCLLEIEDIIRETEDTVKVVFDVPEEEKEHFSFIPGQYLTLVVTIEGKEERRSYSICSGIKEPLAVAIKKVEKGTVSSWFNEVAKIGDEILVAYPSGNFKLTDIGGTYTAFAAGSGITPIMAMAKSIALGKQGSLKLFYGSKTKEGIIFYNELEGLKKNSVDTHYLLSREKHDGFDHGKLDADKMSEIIKNNLDILKSDGFYLCGPEEMIYTVKNSLKTFGVLEDKIHFELFTTPTIMKNVKKTSVANFKGMSEVTIILDDEHTTFDLETDGDTILNELDSHGVDAPYSCRGGVCSTCRAKVIEGAATMDNNMSLTDSEIEEGYILTCQAHPATEKVVISYDE